MHATRRPNVEELLDVCAHGTWVHRMPSMKKFVNVNQRGTVDHFLNTFQLDLRQRWEQFLPYYVLACQQSVGNVKFFQEFVKIRVVLELRRVKFEPKVFSQQKRYCRHENIFKLLRKLQVGHCAPLQ